MRAVMLIKTVPTKVEMILKSMKEMDEVKKAYITYGRFDIVAFVEVQDYHRIRQLSSELNSLDGVRSTETLAEA